MTDTTRSPEPTAAETAAGIAILQQMLDDRFTLLFLGIAIPTVLYIAWGVMAIVTTPVAK